MPLDPQVEAVKNELMSLRDTVQATLNVINDAIEDICETPTPGASAIPYGTQGETSNDTIIGKLEQSALFTSVIKGHHIAHKP